MKELIAQQVNTDNFIAALGPPGEGLTVKKRNHSVIAYYVLLRFLFLHTLFFFELYFEPYLIGTTIS